MEVQRAAGWSVPRSAFGIRRKRIENEHETQSIHHFAGIIKSVGFEVFEIDPFEGGFVGGGE